MSKKSLLIRTGIGIIVSVVFWSFFKARFEKIQEISQMDQTPRAPQSQPKK